jgi:hypothetical protein
MIYLGCPLSEACQGLCAEESGGPPARVHCRYLLYTALTFTYFALPKWIRINLDPILPSTIITHDLSKQLYTDIQL